MGAEPGRSAPSDEGRVQWGRIAVLGGVVAVVAALLMIDAIRTTEVPPPGVAHGYTTTFVPPRDPFEVLLLRADAQAYASLALDPTLGDPTIFEGGSESGSYFARRPVLPALLWLGAAGRRDRLEVASIVVNALSVGALVAAGAALIQVRRRGQDERLAVLVLVVPAVVLQCRNMGVEALGMALATFGLVLWTRREPRRVLASLLFAAAVLTRETMLVIPAVVGLDALLRRRLRPTDALLLLLTPITYVAWAAVVAARYGSLGANGNIGLPFSGFLGATAGWVAVDWAVLALLLVLSVAAVAREGVSLLSEIIVAFWVLASVLASRVWVDWQQFSRILLPVALLAIVIILTPERVPASRPVGSDGVAGAASAVS